MSKYAIENVPVMKLAHESEPMLNVAESVSEWVPSACYADLLAVATEVVEALHAVTHGPALTRDWDAAAAALAKFSKEGPGVQSDNFRALCEAGQKVIDNEGTSDE